MLGDIARGRTLSNNVHGVTKNARGENVPQNRETVYDMNARAIFLYDSRCEPPQRVKSHAPSFAQL